MAAAQRTTIFGKIACRWIVGYLFSQSMGVLAASVGVNVALHAQVPPSADMVVGSAVTMAGVRRALLNRNYGCDGVPGGEGGHCGAEIAHAQIFYPFAYEGLHDRRWDLVIIEGWFKMINVFIHEVRVPELVDKSPFRSCVATVRSVCLYGSGRCVPSIYCSMFTVCF